MSGSKKAADFPEPVGASPIMSRIAYPIGRAYIWMGVGDMYWLRSMFSLMMSGIPSASSQFLIGIGHCPPLI